MVVKIRARMVYNRTYPACGTTKWDMMIRRCGRVREGCLTGQAYDYRSWVWELLGCVERPRAVLPDFTVWTTGSQRGKRRNIAAVKHIRVPCNQQSKPTEAVGIC